MGLHNTTEIDGIIHMLFVHFGIRDILSYIFQKCISLYMEILVYIWKCFFFLLILQYFVINGLASFFLDIKNYIDSIQNISTQYFYF